MLLACEMVETVGCGNLAIGSRPTDGTARLGPESRSVLTCPPSHP